MRPVWIASATIVMSIMFVGCGGDDEIQTYFDEIAPFMDAAADAEEEVSRINTEQARVNLSGLTRTEVTRMAEVSATATANAFDKISTAADALHAVVPPTICAALQDAVYEALQKSEQGYLQLRTAFDQRFAGQDSSTAADQGIRLLSEADRIKSSSLRVVGECK